jgi:hypothetical protein
LPQKAVVAFTGKPMPSTEAERFERENDFMVEFARIEDEALIDNFGK